MNQTHVELMIVVLILSYRFSVLLVYIASKWIIAFFFSFIFFYVPIHECEQKRIFCCAFATMEIYSIKQHKRPNEYRRMISAYFAVFRLYLIPKMCAVYLPPKPTSKRECESKRTHLQYEKRRRRKKMVIEFVHVLSSGMVQSTIVANDFLVFRVHICQRW